MKKFKFYGDDYLEAVDLLYSLPDKAIDSLRLHKFLSLNPDHAWYHWRGYAEKYREAIGYLVVLDFIMRHPEYQEVVLRNNGVKLDKIEKSPRQESMYK